MSGTSIKGGATGHDFYLDTTGEVAVALAEHSQRIRRVLGAEINITDMLLYEILWELQQIHNKGPKP